MRKSFSTIIVMLSIGMIGYAGQLTGTVRTEIGKPLGKVVIYSRSDDQYEAIENFLTTTDEQGNFKLRNHGKVVFFQLPGFEPIVKVHQDGTAHIDVILKSAGTTEWLIPACPERFDPGTYIGVDRIGYRLPIPRGVLTERIRGDHDLFYTVYYRQQDRKESLVYYWSVYAVGFPNEKLILDSTEVSIRSFRNDEFGGIDIHGRFKNGTYWRFIGSGGTEISYKGVSKEAAHYFDNIINGICLAK